jgi:anti-sigma28 factor (negative regulator of flagellin synthesis)
MDVTNNECSARHSPLDGRKAVARPMWENEHPAGDTEILDRLDPSSRAEHESSHEQDCASAMREGKIRALQDAITNGTYHVVAEEIADKMLRDALRICCRNSSPAR